MSKRFAVIVLSSILALPLLGADGHFKILQINDVYKIEGLENGRNAVTSA